MPNNQLRFALRFLARHKGYTAINILGLTLGLCTCLVIYDIVSYEFSFDRSYPGRDRIYRIGGRIRIDKGNGVINESYGKTIPAPAPDALRAEIPFIETLAAYYPYNTGITVPYAGGQYGSANAATAKFEPNGSTILTSKEYFDIFPYTWLAGSPAQSLTQPYSVVLTASRARSYFGDMPAARYINRELIYDDSLHVRVSGIIKDYDGNTDFPNTDFISFSTISHSFLEQKYRNDQWAFNPAIPRIQAFVKLAKNADPKMAATQFDAVWQRHNPAGSFEQFLKFNIVLQPLSDIHFNESYDNDGIRKANRPALYGLIGTAVIILMLAIVNFINLSTAQSLQQAKDIHIRRILGASHIKLILRSLTEAGILTTLSAITAMALIQPVMALFRDYLPERLPLNPFTRANFFFAVGSIIVTTFLAGLYPAIHLVRLPSKRSVHTRHMQQFTLRRVLVVFQFSISLLFIIASLVVSRQINYMLDTNMGFNSTAVVTVNGIDARPQQLRLFTRQALGIPGVQATTVQGHPPAGSPAIQYPMKLDNLADNGLSVNMQDGDEQFIPFYRMKLLAGRNFSTGDSLRAFIINETYSKALGFSKPADAIGHSLTWQGQTHPIVGVVADFHTTSLHSPIPALVIGRLANRDSSVGLRISLSNRQILSNLETLWKKLFNDQPFDYTFLDESIARL